MNTAFLLMAQYDGLAVIPLDIVCRDYFPHLSVRHFKEKSLKGEIKLPLVRIERDSQKSAIGVHLQDLAEWIDERRKEGIEEMKKLNGEWPSRSRARRQNL
ncbi:Pyocin activator protein PrtN [Methylosinus sp. R-45379]|uniref:pyocin activator PrtN family protein n=1 Tax=Methylosinus sp. R-45379 TaxID=980563 RepID=UPI0007C8B163|nr:pyocin activator PrtN family protein [Methylosinus sp. R-45379]OAI31529.1 Pyocin activator protein PrtN [Methylosinus sp. R-45379]